VRYTKKMIKAVIFDCFGVLTTDGWKQLREEFFTADTVKMQHANDIDKAVNAGFMNYDDFIAEIAGMSGLTAGEVYRRLNRAAPNKLLFQYIRDTLKSRYKIAMLSNAADNWLDDMFEPWQVALFDEVVLSYQVGVAKPDSLIYQTVVDRLGLGFDESIFVDDSERYVVAARDLGMQGIYHTDTMTTITAIKDMIHA